MLTKRTTAALVVALVLAVGACSGDNTGASPAASAGGASAPAGSPEPRSRRRRPAARRLAAADISGTLKVDAKYGCKPIPCTPGEGGADEIGTTRVDIFAKQYPDVDARLHREGLRPARRS